MLTTALCYGVVAHGHGLLIYLMATSTLCDHVSQQCYAAILQRAHRILGGANMQHVQSSISPPKTSRTQLDEPM